MPPVGLRLGGIDHGAVTLSKVGELAGFAHEGLGHLDLADDLGEAAVGEVDIFVFDCLKLLPALRGQRGKPHVDRKEQREQDGQRPVIPRGNGQHREGLDDHREEVIGKGLHELRDIGNRAIQSGDDRAGDLVIVIALREGQQLGKVARGQNLAQARDHDIADVAADIAEEGIGGVGKKKRHCQQQHRAQRIAQWGVVLQGAHDGIGGFARQKRRDQCNDRSDRGGQQHA